MSEKLNYEDAILELEKIARELESDEISLEESVGSFKRAMEIYKYSEELLNKAEGEIKILLEKSDGDILKEDFLVEG